MRDDIMVSRLMNAVLAKRELRFMTNAGRFAWCTMLALRWHWTWNVKAKGKWPICQADAIRATLTSLETMDV